MLEPGIIGKCNTVVTEQMTAESVGSGLLKVLATPSLIALAEKTANESVMPQLETGFGTVGISVNIKHTAPTPVGETIRAESELTEVDGRRLVFKIRVFDEIGLVGEGTHERFIINNEKFIGKMNENHKKA